MRWWLLWAALTVISLVLSVVTGVLRPAAPAVFWFAWGFVVFATLTVVSMFFGRSELD